MIVNGSATLTGSSVGGSTSAGSTLTLAGPVVVDAAATATVNNVLTVTGAVSGPGVLSVAGIGTLTLSGDNSAYLSGFNLNTGTVLGAQTTLIAGSATALGGGAR